MSEFKKCANGHFYQDSYDKCPYCPQVNSKMENELGRSESFNNEKTQVFSRTAELGRSDDSFNPEKTQVVSSQSSISNNQLVVNIVKPTNTRRLVGWVVTFDQNPNGKDFRIFEGRNTFGFSRDNDVVVDFDSSVSTKHLTILFRLGEFLFKDEMSTNGTFLNDVLTTEGNLKDGDRIKIGNVVFLFRTAQF